MDNSPVWDIPLLSVSPDVCAAALRRDLGFVERAKRPSDEDYDRYLSLLLTFRELNYDPDRVRHRSPFCVADISFNSILARADEDLIWLLGITNARQEQVLVMRDRERLINSLEAQWRENCGLYVSRDVRSGGDLCAQGVAGFFPLFAGSDVALRHPAIRKRLAHWLAGARFGASTCDPDAPGFDPECYWRGPVWLIVNWMLADGLRRNGLLGFAKRLRDDSLDLFRKAGAAEYFDPFTGAALGGVDFSWTAAMALVLSAT